MMRQRAETTTARHRDAHAAQPTARSSTAMTVTAPLPRLLRAHGTLLTAAGNRAVAGLVARYAEGGQSRPALASEAVATTPGVPSWLAQIYVQAGLIPAEDVPAMLAEAGPAAAANAQRCRELAANPIEARRVHLEGRESRARRLDWSAVANAVTPADGTGRGVVAGQSLRHVFYARRQEQLQETFGVGSVDLVLSAVELAEAGGRPDVASALRAQLFRANQYAVVGTLNVSTSARYQPGGGRTYCNIYAHDFVTAMGGYLPRVWWTTQAWSRIQDGAEIVSPAELDRLRREGESTENVVAPVYAQTVTELNANALNRWMRGTGGEFGWRGETNMDAAQAAANSGQVVILLAANANPRRSGHVTVVLAESPQRQAHRDEHGRVQVPLQSQAGSRNFRYSAQSGAPGSNARQWWAARTHIDGAAWIFTGANSSLLVKPEEVGLQTPE
jgi:hypothetical protein